MSKLELKAQKSKLHTRLEENNIEENEKVLRKFKSKELPKSFRIDNETINVLKETYERINNLTPRKVSESRIIKALILLSKDISDQKLIKAIKEIW